MTIPKAHLRAYEAAAESGWGFASDALKAHRASKARVRVKQAPRKADAAAAAKEAFERHAALVLKAVARAEEVCELCNGSLEGLPFELHHLEMGSAKGKNERLSNVMITHPVCHRAYHLHAGNFTKTVREWCLRHGYPLPQRKEFR
jgi:hypothetical protein